jgi:transcriptional regulator of NAD metabolism
MAVCQGRKRDGTPCTVSVPRGELFCYNHDPARAEERRRNASHAATAKHSSVARELREVREMIVELLGILLADNLPIRVRKELQSVVQLLQCYLRAAELEMRAAEEPLRSDLDVTALKGQVLGRIEELGAREREREEILSELVPAMEARGLDTGAVQAVMDG